MNNRDRRMLNEVGLNFIENIEKWRIVKNVADSFGFELTLFKSSGKYRYALYFCDNMGRPRNSRSNRVVNYQEVLAPHSYVKEDMVFDFYLDNFFHEYIEEDVVDDNDSEPTEITEIITINNNLDEMEL